MNKTNIDQVSQDREYDSLVEGLGNLIESSRGKIQEAIRAAMLQLYWQICQQIVEFEQKGQTRAAYKTKLLIQLSKDLVMQYGKGFSASNLYNMRLFYQRYPIIQTSGKLMWGHYCELVGIDDDLERSFYEQQCALENWSVRELQRQKSTMLFHRFALSTDKKGVLALAKEGKKTVVPTDVLRDPYILMHEFLTALNYQ